MMPECCNLQQNDNNKVLTTPSCSKAIALTMLQSRRCNMQNENASSSYMSDVPNQAMYDRIVMVPATNYQRVPLSQAADFAVSGHRQPIEHPNDNPMNRRIQTRQNPGLGHQSASAPILHEMEKLSIRTPSEHQFEYEEKDNNILHGVVNNANAGMSAIQTSQQKVQEWRTSANDNDENNSYNEDLSSFVISEQFSEGDSNFSHTSDASLSRKNSGYVGDFDYSDDDGTGLQKSLSGIQSPPGVMESACSRQNSNGSQSSLDSSLSFHTVYPSDAYAPKPQRPMQPDRNRQQQPQQNPSAGRNMATDPHHSGITRPQATTSTEAYSGRSPFQPGPSGYHRQLTGQSGQSGQSGVRQINQIADANSRQDVEQKPTSVFITYAEERQDSNFRKLVLQLTKTLLSNGIQVRLDMLESTLISMSVSSWLDDNIQKCDFVVICVSPSYKSEVEQQLSSETPEPHSLHTRYIYNRLLSEYIQNGSRNYRFIPVLIGRATRRDLPSLCLDTTVYKWPEHFEAIIYRLFKKEKYIQPRVGPPPKVTVETYQSQED